MGLDSLSIVPELDADLNFNSQSGVDIGYLASLDVGLTKTIGKSKFQLNVSSAFNNRRGLKELTLHGTSNFNYKLAKVTGRMNAGLGSVFSFGDFTYFPTSDLPLVNESVALNLKAGTAFMGAHPNLAVSGYGNRQYLFKKQDTQRAYGYLYHQDGQERPQSLQDYNLESPIPYREDMPNLSPAYGTYDIFNATGQGAGGQFRTTRSDVGIFRPAYSSNIDASLTVGGEIGAGAYFHIGANGIAILAENNKGSWRNENFLKNSFSFTSDNELYQSSLIKASGETTVTNEALFNQLGSDVPVSTELTQKGLTTIAKKRLNKKTGEASTNPLYPASNLRQGERSKRNQVFQYLTGEEAEAAGLDKTIYSYAGNTLFYNNCGNNVRTAIDRVDDIRKPHHISSVNITQPDGSKYVYGIPAYNYSQKEVSFSVNSTGNPIDELVPYDPAIDNTVNNNKGQDNFFDAQTIPAYAYSYLLTGVLSPDYVDRTGDGITDDDIGNAVKLNYTRIWGDDFKDDEDKSYNWRVPIEKNMARYQAGYASDDEDDRGNYIFGQKEIWYLHSVESRTMVAQFYTSGRADAIGAGNAFVQSVNENGGVSNVYSLNKLDSVALYAKSDLIENGGDALPIKTVHFEYNYDLCDGVPNSSQGGKLTLEKVFFTYGKSQRGKLNAYKFQYSNSNPDYNIAAYDRWGCYKASSHSGFNNPNYPSAANFPSNKDFPYCLQDQALSDEYNQAWNLSEITLPSGGVISVDYESDDYAYVQDKRAGQMLFVKGFTNNEQKIFDETLQGGDISNELYQNRGRNTEDINNYLIVDLPESLQSQNASKEERRAELQERYFGDVKELYFKCEVRLLGDGSNDYDYITGYMDYNAIHPIGDDQMAVEVKTVRAREKNANKRMHPISKATLQTMRLNLPELVNPDFDLDNDLETNIRSLGGFASAVKDFSQGFDRSSMTKRWAKVVNTDHAWIRLSNPNYKKLGGGCRVKKLMISDEWDVTANDDRSFYGQEYNYEKTVEINGEDRVISSGVAAYEPFMGGEENLMKRPLNYIEEITLGPDNYYYTETPIGEKLFPAPVVGYSQVTVRNLQYANVSRTATGYSVNEYYTAQDFPTIVDRTIKDSEKVKANPINKFFNLGVNEQLAVAQGFAIELNDMHGKMKKESVFNEAGSLISSSEYLYKTKKAKSTRQQLANQVAVIQPNGSITQAVKGLEFDVWQYMDQEVNKSDGRGIKGNLEGLSIFNIPIPFPVPIPAIQSSKKVFRSATTTKLIKRTGILDRVIVTENGSTLTTENVLFDSETGDVLLTRTENEFNDDMFQFTYPAHWAYEGMEQVYQNIGGVFENIAVSVGSLPTEFNSLLYRGDEVLIRRASGDDYEKYYVVRGENTNFSLVDEEGNRVFGNGNATINYMKVIKSGRENQAMMPIASVMSRKQPTDNNFTMLQFDDNTKVLESNATTFNDSWKVNCERNPVNGELIYDGFNLNPYPYGRRGVWRPQQSFVFYNTRNRDRIKEGGTVQDFYPFWEYNGSEWQTPQDRGVTNEELWTRTNTVTRYDNRGNELENEDAIGVFSAAYFGYNDTRVTTIAANSMREEMNVDGFEDYIFFNDCGEDINQVINRKNVTLYDASQGTSIASVAHTGKASLSFEGDVVFKTYLDTDCPDEPTISEIETDPGCTNCDPQLDLQEGKDYWMSFWIATDESLVEGGRPSAVFDSLEIGDEARVTLDFPLVMGGQLVRFDLRAESPIIDGWQKYSVRFKVPQLDKDSNGKSHFQLSLIQTTSTSQSGDRKVYLDDFRLHPFRSNMKSYVYDPYSLRLLAELDENNYATFYEYDDEGILIRVKRETEKGIVSVQEARTTLSPNN